MNCLDVVWGIVPKSSIHPSGVNVIGYDFAVISEFVAADSTAGMLSNDFLIQQFPHLGW
jgi:hypothetical protein